MFRFLIACSPGTIHLLWNTNHRSLLVIITRMPCLPAVTACIHRAHQFRCNEQSTQDALVGRALADSQKCIRVMGSKYADMGKTLSIQYLEVCCRLGHPHQQKTYITESSCVPHRCSLRLDLVSAGQHNRLSCAVLYWCGDLQKSTVVLEYSITASI